MMVEPLYLLGSVKRTEYRPVTSWGLAIPSIFQKCSHNEQFRTKLEVILDEL